MKAKLLLAAIFIILVILGYLETAGNARAQPAFPPIGTQASSFFNATQTITKTISGVSGKRIYLTQLSLNGVAAGVFTLTVGTGTNCGTNPVVIYAKTLAAGDLQAYIGDGAGIIAVMPTGVDVCVTIATQLATGWISWAQF